MKPATDNIEHETGLLLPDLCSAQAVLLLVLVTELLALCLLLFAHAGSQFDWVGLGRTSLFMQWTTLSSAALLCLLRNWLVQRPLALGATIAYLIIIALCALFSIIAELLMGGLAALEVYLQTTRLARNLLICAVLAGITLRYFYLQGELQRRQRAELQARLEALHARIRPHFLFNTMNSIASLIAEDPNAAEQAVEDLAELFRASLSDADKEVEIGDELALCRRYLGIEAHRLGDRLSVVWQLDDLPRGVKLPSLSLQPLVENAIYHGIQPRLEGGEIRINVANRGKHIEITVSNPLPVESHGAEQGNRMAIENIRQRLRALHGDEAQLLIDRSVDSFVVRLICPTGILP